MDGLRVSPIPFQPLRSRLNSCNARRVAPCIALLLLAASWRGAYAAATVPPEIVVASYNLENYLGEASPEETAHRRARPKSEKAMNAVVRIIKEIHPDVLGVCEMGSPEEFEAFKSRLAAEGLGFVESEYVKGPDPDRHLALLSRFPIVARHSLPEVSYEMNGVPEKVKRGFLDVTIRINPDYNLRMVGVHLKSKLVTVSDPSEALMRRHEADLLRRHLDEIMAAEPDVNLLAYGDFNETRNQPAIQEIIGPRGSPGFMADLPAKDSGGDRWTQYWRPEDLYSRIDYFLASRGLIHEIVSEKTRIYRSDDWNDASDHRPIYTSIIPVNRKH